MLQSSRPFYAIFSRHSWLLFVVVSSSYIISLSLSLVIPLKNHGTHLPLGLRSSRAFVRPHAASVCVMSQAAEKSEAVVQRRSKSKKRSSDNTSRSEINGKSSTTRKKKYKRKRIPESEKERLRLKREREAKYKQITNGEVPSVWRFESLFPKTHWDKKSVEEDLYGSKKRDEKVMKTKLKKALALNQKDEVEKIRVMQAQSFRKKSSVSASSDPFKGDVIAEYDERKKELDLLVSNLARGIESWNTTAAKVDEPLSRMVADRMNGMRRDKSGSEYQYETSLMEDGAVKFRDGVRLGYALQANADRLNYFAKQELRHGRIEEAQELYELAINIDERDGRAYLGLARCAERRRDFKRARQCLKIGIANSLGKSEEDKGANPFLLQALGCLEEKMGNLAEAEALYIAAAKSRSSHAAAWVSLAQIRTRKLGQSAASGRACFQTAERELEIAGKKPSSYVYTAWAALENEFAGDTRKARELFKKALDVDPKCSAALLQLGVMEAGCENWDDAEACFKKVLTFDQRNTRVLQAYAIMETKRPRGSSRKAIELFERALKIRPRDAGILQPYALYVIELGDVDAARKLLRRGTKVNKRHAPAWQAWGVMEMRQGNPEEARKVFQKGIWACAQLSGGQSGGYSCARLWQAWGVLEAKEGEYDAARRCFSRALDADSRNVATVTAWTHMEECIGNILDARAIFERALKKFSAGSHAKKTIWSAYELMEARSGNSQHAQQVYQRSLRDLNDQRGYKFAGRKVNSDEKTKKDPQLKDVLKESQEDVFLWTSGSSRRGEVWTYDGSIEGQFPMVFNKI